MDKLDNTFDTTIMYYYSFDENLKNKNIQILNKLIDNHNIVYKLVFEVIYNNNRSKIDYDDTKLKDLIFINNQLIKI